MDLEKLPKFSLNIDPNDSSTGVEFISFVDYPAIEVDFVTLSKQRETFKVSSKQKQFLTGPALIPDKLIYREYDGIPYTVFFKKETIEEIVKKFFKDNNIFNTNENHIEELDGNYIIESWIIGDNPKRDKSRNLGFKDLPAGTWMVTYHVPNKEYWEEKILTGEIKGFSIEGIFRHIEETEEFKSMLIQKESKIENLNNTQMKKDSNTLSKIKELIGLSSEDKEEKVEEVLEEKVEEEVIEQSFVDYTSADGTKLFMDEADNRLFIVETNEDGEENMIPFEGDAEVALDDGSILVVVDGIVTEKIEAEPEAEAEEEMTQDEIIELTAEDGTVYLLNLMNNELFTSVDDDQVRVEGNSEIKLNDGRIMIVEEGLFTGFITVEEQRTQNIESQLKETTEKLEELSKSVLEIAERLAKFSKEPADDKLNTNSHSKNQESRLQRMNEKRQRSMDLIAKLRER